jgi:hypothetical protein
MPASDLHHTATTLAQMLAFHCVRNSYLEELQDGRLHRCKSHEPLWRDRVEPLGPHQ